VSYVVAWGYYAEHVAEYATFAPALRRYRAHVLADGIDAVTLSGSSRCDDNDDGLTLAERELRDDPDCNRCECTDILERLDVLNIHVRWLTAQKGHHEKPIRSGRAGRKSGQTGPSDD